MPEEIMILGIVSMGCFTGIVITAMQIFGSRLRGRDHPKLESEIASLRKEINDLKAVSADVVLSLDSTLQRQTLLLQAMEQRMLGEGQGRGETAIWRRSEARSDAETVEVGPHA